MNEQELMKIKRRYEQRTLEYRQINKRLKYVILFLLIIVLGLAILLVVSKIRNRADGAGTETEKFTGEKRIEMRHIEATY